jgi:hypothetical protein
LQLRDADADILIQIVGEDLLWQKERLLNIGLQALPPACRTIAWLDCDIVFERDDWGQGLTDALDRFALVQPFVTFSELSADAQFQNGHPPTASLGEGHSVAYKLATGATVDELFRPGKGNRLNSGRTLGMGWAARRDLLERHGFYDACILGSGDKAMVLAALGRFELSRSLDMNARQTAHYLAWAQPFFEAVHANIGYVDGRVYHLWHGDLKDRSHRLRHVNFARFGFDPFVDITLAPCGCWRWTVDKPELRAYMQEYFESRNEDGARRRE